MKGRVRLWLLQKRAAEGTKGEGKPAIGQGSEKEKQAVALGDPKPLEEIAKGAKELYRVRTIFPFDFFPKDLVIDEYKVSIIYRYFFWSEEVISIYIKDLGITLGVGLLFASLKLSDKRMLLEEGKQVFDLNFFWKEEARRARRIIQGLIIMHEQKAKVSPEATPEEVRAQAEEIGRSRERGVFE